MPVKTLTVDAAEAEAREAVEAAEKLRRDLIEGDLTIKGADVRKAEQAAEDAALRLAGAKAAKARADAEDLEQRGIELHDEFVTEIVADFEKVEAAVVGFQQAAGALIDSLTTYEDRRLGYKSKWSGLFAGNTELAAALRFKAGGRPGGDFGALDDPHSIARHINPVQTLVALLGEVVGPRDTKLTGFDQTLQVFLRQGAYREGLKSLRELRRQLDK